jgi:hypothetical protein
MNATQEILPATGVDADPEAGGGVEKAFARCIARLELLVDGETDALRNCAAINFDDYNTRKTHALLEFLRVSRAMPDQTSPETAFRLAELRGKLAVNARLLDQHLNAMVEIATIMIRNIEREESDGTYSGKPQRSR